MDGDSRRAPGIAATPSRCIVFAQRIGLTLAQHWSQTEDGGSHRQDHALRAATDTAKVLEAIGN